MFRDDKRTFNLYQQNNMAALETAVLRSERAAVHKYSGTLFKGRQM